METGEISRKLRRGRHTTRHAQLIQIDTDTYLMDTPGFSALTVEDMDKEELKEYFMEFRPYEEACRFQGCVISQNRIARYAVQWKRKRSAPYDMRITGSCLRN